MYVLLLSKILERIMQSTSIHTNVHTYQNILNHPPTMTFTMFEMAFWYLKFFVLSKPSEESVPLSTRVEVVAEGPVGHRFST
jgi:hypothetical protein